MILTIAEKPELAGIIAKAFGGEVKKSGYWECANNNIVTSCFGHMLVLTPPDKINPSYKTWVMSDLPMDLTEVSHEVKPSDGDFVERQYNIIANLLKNLRRLFMLAIQMMKVNFWFVKFSGKRIIKTR